MEDEGTWHSHNRGAASISLSRHVPFKVKWQFWAIGTWLTFITGGAIILDGSSQTRIQVSFFSSDAYTRIA